MSVRDLRNKNNIISNINNMFFVKFIKDYINF